MLLKFCVKNVYVYRIVSFLLIKISIYGSLIKTLKLNAFTIMVLCHKRVKTLLRPVKLCHVALRTRLSGFISVRESGIKISLLAFNHDPRLKLPLLSFNYPVIYMRIYCYCLSFLLSVIRGSSTARLSFTGLIFLNVLLN